MRAYLDIETTGLNQSTCELTVIGIHCENGDDCSVTQLVGNEISPDSLIRALDGITTLYTYNGARFDLPFILAKLGIDLKEYCRHEDLMYACWRRNLRGGLKSVERQLGIERTLTDVDGWIAVQLWQNYIDYNDRRSLKTLLKYNEEDVLNLKVLRERLDV